MRLSQQPGVREGGSGLGRCLRKQKGSSRNVRLCRGAEARHADRWDARAKETGTEYVWGLKERASGMLLGKVGNGIKMLSISGWSGGGGRDNGTGFNQLNSKHWQDIQVETLCPTIYTERRRGPVSFARVRSACQEPLITDSQHPAPTRCASES